MADTVSVELRSKMMSSVRSKNSKIESTIARGIWNQGIRFRKNTGDLFGTPDISIKKYKIVIFIDSCFWHACPIHGKIPKSNTPYWEEKMRRNRQRDSEVNHYYDQHKWHILRIWEHDIKSNPELCINQAVAFIEQVKCQYETNCP